MQFVSVQTTNTTHIQIKTARNAGPYTNRIVYALIISLRVADGIYRNTPNIRRTKSQNLNVCRLILQLSLSNPLKLDAKSRIKM